MTGTITPFAIPAATAPARPARMPSPVHPSAGSPAAAPRPGLAATLIRGRRIAPHALFHALGIQRRDGGRLEDILLSQALIAPDALCAVIAAPRRAATIDPRTAPPDAALATRLGPAFCLREGVLPWRRVGAATVILTATPEDFMRLRPRLEARFGPVIPALAARPWIEEALLCTHGHAMAQRAETRVPAAHSCRREGGAGRLPVILALALAVLALAAWIAPLMLGLALLAWAVLTLVLGTALKAAAAWAARRPAARERAAPLMTTRPVVSVLVALYHEDAIAARLVRRLERLDYPRDLLDIVLAVEDDDHPTRDELARAGLPPWMRVAVVPAGTVRTKPRALNFALDLCRGSIVGVYDAEDAPAPDQIARVVQRFHERPERVACLQGVLDFYNPRANWLARSFTLEYAAWFRVVLPGLARLGMPVPLGGTTLFFRREALERLGGWDAHNVTEDADLGIRLARHGLRTEMIDSVTEEEANCRAYPWIRQRSRWIKGYMMTWAVHIRDPVLLWRELGAWQFCGFQVLFLATLSQVLLAPLLWSFWLLMAGLHHPLTDALPQGALIALTVLFLMAEAVNLGVAWQGIRRTRHGLSPWWLLATKLYFPLATLAAYKAACEAALRPYFWDKTSHGHFDVEAAPDQRVRTSPASIFRRVS